jgi:hypothetical protein
MTRLPIPGGDDNNWGNILNDFLGVAHDPDGSLIAGSVGASTLQTGPGNDGQVLTKDSTQTGGMKWAAATGLTGVKFDTDGSLAGTRPELNFIQGSGVSLTATDNSGSNRVDLTIAATPGSTRLAADYVLYVSGGTTHARNGSTGTDDYSGADSASVLQSAITALGNNGGTIGFQAGTYTWGTTPGIPPNLNGWLRLVAEPGVTVNLSAGSGTRFLDFAKQTDGDTFRYLFIEGFTVNAAALNTTGGTQHIVIGTYQGATGTISGQNVNFDRLVIRRIRTLNVRTALAATANHLNIFISLYQNSAGLPQNTCTNVLIEQCDFSGGNYGIGMTAGKNGTWTGEANIKFDNITIRDIRHDTGTNPVQSSTHAHVHVGGRGTGGTIWVERVWGKGSWDVGVEIDGFRNAHVSDCYIENCFGFAMAVTNYQAPSDWHRQVYQYSRCALVRSAGQWSPNASSLLGLIPATNTSGVAQPFGRVIAHDMKVYVDGTNLPDLWTDQMEGDLLYMTGSPLEMRLDGAAYYAENLSHTSTTNSPTPTMIFTQPSSRTKLTLRDIDITFNGTAGAGATEMDTTALFLGGLLDLLTDNVSVNYSWINLPALSLRAMDIGSAASSNIHGTVRGLRVTSSDTSGRGIIVRGTGTLTVPNQLRIVDCDFSGMVGGTEILYIATSNAPKVWTYGVKWRTFPKAAYNITAPSSATAAQYLDTWAGTMIITGNNVSLVEISRDGTTFYQIATSGNTAFQINHTDWYRITYTVAPIVRLIPQI